MGKILKLATILFLCSFLLNSICIFNNSGQIIQNNGLNGQIHIKLDPAMDIRTNAVLSSYASQGDGTPGNPYIIKNKVIDSSALSVAAIYIEDTTAYFELRNCTILKTKATYNGIRFNNVTHGTIVNCTIKNSGQIGISFDPTCTYDNIIGNTIFNCATVGILLTTNCDYNNITGNTIYNCTNTGIFLTTNCDYNTISFNTVYSSRTYHGIHLWYFCTHNTVISNNASFNKQYGIGLDWWCTLNSVINNTVQNNQKDGISLSMYSNGNTLINNTVTANGLQGITLKASGWNTLSGNTANSNDGTGIVLIFGSGTYNLIFFSGNSSYNTLNGNTASENQYDGICIGTSNNNTLNQNIANENGFNGFLLWYTAKANNLTVNTASHNKFNGINLTNSNANRIIGNTALYNLKGINLSNSLNNIIQNNILIDLLSPTNTTYLEPMSGYYPATYGFENVPNGQDDPEWQDTGSSSIVASWAGHNKVYQCASNGALGLKNTFSSPQASGTVELYMNEEYANYGFQGRLFGSGDTMLINWRFYGNRFEYNNITHFISIGKSLLNTVWYHICIDFETTNGNYLGLAQWTYRIYLDGESFGPYKFMANYTPTYMHFYCGSQPNKRNIDAIGFSWDPNYHIGDNLKEGLLLNFSTYKYFNWLGYSIRGQSVIQINHTTILPMPATGCQSIQMFGTDAVGSHVSKKIYFTNNHYFPLDIANHLENGQSVPPGDTELLSTEDLNITLTYRTRHGPSIITWTNASILYKINAGTWKGPYVLGYTYDYQTSNFIIDEGNYSNLDDLYYYFFFKQYDNSSTLINEQYWTQDGPKDSELEAQTCAFHKPIHSIIYQLSLNYSVWYSARVENRFRSETGGNVSVFQWAHISYENITLSYYNVTSSMNNFTVACFNASQLNHYINDTSKTITHIGPPFFTGLQSPFILDLQKVYTPFNSTISIPMIDYEWLPTDHYLNFTGMVLNLTFIEYEHWPYSYRTVLKFTSGLNLTVRFDCSTGIMVYYEHIWGNENTSRKITFGLRGNNQSAPINLAVEKRIEIVSGGFTIIPSYVLSIVYDPPGDHSFSQLSVGTKITYGINIQDSSSKWGYSCKTLNKYTVGTSGGENTQANLGKALLEGIPFIGPLLRTTVDECRASADFSNFEEIKAILGPTERGGEWSGMISTGEEYACMVEFTSEKTITSSLNSENAALIGPGRGDLYTGASLIICYYITRENHYIIIEESDDPLMHVDDIYVWNSNDSRTNYIFEIASQFSVLGAYLDSYNMTQVAQYNLFADNTIGGGNRWWEAFCAVKLPENPIFWTPEYIQEISHSHSTTTTTAFNFNLDINWKIFECTHVKGDQFYKRICLGDNKYYGPPYDVMVKWENETIIEYPGEFSLSLTTTTSSTENRQIMCHLEDDDGTPIGEHDQFLMDIYEDLRYGTLGFITYENFTYSSDPFEFGTRDRRPPATCQIVGLPEYLHGTENLECGATDAETGMSYVQYYINDYPILDLSDSKRIGVQSVPMPLKPSIYQLSWDTSGLPTGTYYLFAVAYDNAIPLKNMRISSPYMIQIDNILPSSCQMRVYGPFSGAINLYANVLDADSGTDYVEYWDGNPIIQGSTLLGASSDSSSSFNFVWATDPGGSDDGLHYIYARGYDRAGNFLDSSAISLTVDSQDTGDGIVTIDNTGPILIGCAVIAGAVAAAILGHGILVRKRSAAPVLEPKKQPTVIKPPKGA